MKPARRDWRVHLGPVSAVLWGAAMLLMAVPAGAQGQGINLSGGMTVSWAQLLFVGAVGAFAGRINSRLDNIEKSLDKKQDKRE